MPPARLKPIYSDNAPVGNPVDGGQYLPALNHHPDSVSASFVEAELFSQFMVKSVERGKVGSELFC